MCNQVSGLKEMLQETSDGQMSNKKPGWKYAWHEEFVLANGKQFLVVPFPKEYKYAIGKTKDCYRNAFYLADKYPSKLKYAEGFALSKDIPFFPTLHAWCVDGDKVIDPTWKNSGLEYIGVPFAFEYVRNTITQRGFFGVLDNWQDKYPLLRGVATGWKG